MYMKSHTNYKYINLEQKSFLTIIKKQNKNASYQNVAYDQLSRDEMMCHHSPFIILVITSECTRITQIPSRQVVECFF